ncbi:Adenine nucleotide alpha hydrolases-like superfamily protein isoform 1 [Hibiscus syriacus]|uniref:Adenine nucleotide alpha hydrolases-like superfamily protein isoform 1 n=1 Tax=Hibiscus syriacus TaxID=106335 RepID=A0A6A2YP37_HIBSY|nr:B-box zinc finger protein 32-like [Hibiscus syriacus]KAE8681057.1 Adenine nucleotide alpha hydrolases-like superfamily protein isoform 1 [Hibiscus syriacus]
MRKCELCGELARMHCESDQANLCWDCDVKVHGANFLVAKHTRTLLCHVCQNPTPWLASGQHLSPAVSVCESCVAINDNICSVSTEPEESSEADHDDEEDDYDDFDEEEEDEEEEEEEDAENQVVPWSGGSSFSMTKSVASSDSFSSTENGDGGGAGAGFGLKRTRRSLSFCSEDEIACSSSHVGSRGSSNRESSSSMSNFTTRLLEANHSAIDQDDGETESRSTAIISSLKSLQNHMIIDDNDASATIIGICRLSRDQSR